MNHKLAGILEALLKMNDATNEELLRLSQNYPFTNSPHCLDLIENLRSSYMNGLQNLRIIEHRLVASGLHPPEGE